MAIITVPTLILLALLLDANIQENFGSEDDANSKSTFIVLIFGFGFILLSLLVCGCIMHKMRMCLWTRSRYSDTDDPSTNGNGSNGMSAGGSRLSNCSHIIDMPPSYDTVINRYKCDLVAGDAAASLAHMTRMSVLSWSSPPTYDSLGIEPCAFHINEMPSGATSNHI